MRKPVREIRRRPARASTGRRTNDDHRPFPEGPSVTVDVQTFPSLGIAARSIETRSLVGSPGGDPDEESPGGRLHELVGVLAEEQERIVVEAAPLEVVLEHRGGR